MDNPVCFSNYFINKQNVRSINHALNFKLLNKKSKTDFLLGVLEDQLLVSELSSDFLDSLLTARTNFINSSKEDFKNYFIRNEELRKVTKFKIMPVLKVDVFAGCWKAMYEIIPKGMIGSQKNMKIFKDVVRVVVCSMKNHHIFLYEFTRKWDLNVYPWNTLSSLTVNQILSRTLFWILRNILSTIICLNFFVTSCKLDSNENKLYFFWRNEWQSFYDRKITELIYSKVIRRYDANCMGNKIKRKYSPQERLRIRNANREIPKLHLVLKSNSNYRPIVRYKNNASTLVEKNKIKDRLNFLRVLTGKQQNKIESKYCSFYLSWIAQKQPKLYFVKADLSNAFGSIIRERLMMILSEKHVIFQKNLKNTQLKKKYAQIYNETTIELRKPLLVRAGATVYEWREGLVQGYKYSPALSELYYTYMDELYFSAHWKKYDSQLKLFVRVVDDYLYITDSIDDAHSFLEALSSYRNVNYEKTVVNFPHPTIKFEEDITFLGYTYNTANLQVHRASNIYTGPMCYKINFSNAVSEITKFLENRIGQSGIQVNSHLFNLNYNNEELIWKHIFLTLCLSANKFCTILAILCSENEMEKFFELYKRRVTVKLCNALIEILMKNKPKEVLFIYCINHFRYLSYLALSLCSKGTSKCRRLVSLSNVELARTNCIFGKFREHSSRIDKSGKCLCPAVKEVCRRAGLRKIMKQFEVLPQGFECYNPKKYLNEY